MIIFPFGFYILAGKTPVYVGNDPCRHYRADDSWHELPDL